MYHALGRAVKKNDDGTFLVKVEILDDRTTQTVRFETYTASSLQDLRQQIAQDLKHLRDNEQDSTLTAAFVGVVLGEI